MVKLKMSNNEIGPDNEGFYKDEKKTIIGNDVYTTEKKWNDYDDYYVTHKKNGLYHNTEQYAVFESLNDGNDVYAAWYYNGQLHNINGYALVCKDFILDKFSFKYFLFGKEYSKKEYDEKLVQIKNDIEEGLKQSDLTKEACSIINKFIS